MNQKGLAVIPILLALLIISILIGGAYYFGKSQSIKPTIQTPQAVPTLIATTETSNWKTYNYSVKGLELSFRYPPDWEKFPQGEGGGVSFYAPTYSQLDGTINIEPLLPQESFQTVCSNEIKNARQWNWIDIKETQTKINDIPVTTLRGKIGHIDNKVHDRLYAVLMDENHCVRVDALSYNNPSQQAIFDQILSTFKFTN